MIEKFLINIAALATIATFVFELWRYRKESKSNKRADDVGEINHRR